jgi:hypothetical protein
MVRMNPAALPSQTHRRQQTLPQSFRNRRRMGARRYLSGLFTATTAVSVLALLIGLQMASPSENGQSAARMMGLPVYNVTPGPGDLYTLKFKTNLADKEFQEITFSADESMESIMMALRQAGV